jgi:hypothetical protein
MSLPTGLIGNLQEQRLIHNGLVDQAALPVSADVERESAAGH